MVEFAAGSTYTSYQKNESDQRTIIKVIGVGGAGGNTINRMIESGMKNVDFIAVNTDKQDLDACRAKTKLLLGTPQGLGAGGIAQRGREAAEEKQEELKELLEETNMVFITAGMGGGTGTGAAPVIAKVARELGCLTVAVVTKPFDFEGPQRYRQAEEGVDKLSEIVDALITIPNQQLCQIVERKVSFHEAFKLADDVLANGVRGISEIITINGDINVDFKDVETIMANKGNALLGMVLAGAEDPVEKIADEVVNNPLVEGGCIDGATGLLIHVTCGTDIPFQTGTDLFAEISRRADTSNATIITGLAMDSEFDGKIRVTVIATGFEPHLREEEMFDTEDVGENTAADRTSRSPELAQASEDELTSASIMEKQRVPAGHRQKIAGSGPVYSNPDGRAANNDFPKGDDEAREKIYTDDMYEQESDKVLETSLLDNSFLKNSDITNLDIPTFLRRRDN